MKKTVQKTIAALLLAGMLLSPQAALAGVSADEAEEVMETVVTAVRNANYEAVPPQYSYDDNAVVKTPDDASSRFVKKEGIYVNPDAEDTGKATLMITGDLMCQFRQQEAQFVSSGKGYISYNDYMKILVEAKERQAAAVAQQTAASGMPVDSGLTASTGASGAGTSGAGASGAGGPAGADSNAPADEDSNESTDKDVIPALPGTSVSVPALDLGVIPQPEGTWNFCDSFVYTREILRRGDLVIGNLETMVSQSSPLGMQIHRLEDKPYLNAPASYLDALKYAGYDLLTMANNHNVDTGLRGIYETLRNVNDWGFMHTGLFSSESDDRYIIVEVNGIRIGMVSYSAFYNDKDSNLTESGQDVLLNRYASDKAKADIRAARKAGAEFVIAFIHWGAENTHDTTWNQEQYARTLARAGADYIVGSHPHALQRYDIIETSDGREVPVIYSMGNFLSNMQRDINNDTIILQLNLQREEDGSICVASHRIYPCTVLHSAAVKAPGTVSNGITSTAAQTRSVSYLIVPQQAQYRSLIDTSVSAGRENLKFLDESLARTMEVFSRRTALPLPYDPYDIESDEPSAPLLSPKGAANRLGWILANAAASR
ncbi:MAG: CapA family protein [Firmicutes bacterium]|nr:CapA family protein [Bacillota bacterium]MDY5857316.1 CapA family protein [Anaerovoracaceae bacterium]